MVGATRGFSRTASTPSTGAPGAVGGIGSASAGAQTLPEVIRDLAGSSVETIERGKTIFFPGDPAERVYLLRRGAVRLSRVYESGEEITVALLRENSLFGVLSLLTGQRSDRFYHAIAFTRVEMVTAPAPKGLRWQVRLRNSGWPCGPANAGPYRRRQMESCRI